MRVDEEWSAWLKELTTESGRRFPSAFVRDLIFMIRFTNQGEQIMKTMKTRKLDYARFARTSQAIVKARQGKGKA